MRREFRASEPNRLWVADITFVPTAEGFLYLATVLDVFSRKVVGWAMSARQTAALVSSALAMAIDTRAPREVVFHSDRGCQYTALAFTRSCEQAGVQRSMGAVGSCYDNAMAESLFATVECELLQRVRFATREQARSEIFRFLEGFYNRRRRHSGLGYLSPVEFERRWHEQREPARFRPVAVALRLACSNLEQAGAPAGFRALLGSPVALPPGDGMMMTDILSMRPPHGLTALAPLAMMGPTPSHTVAPMSHLVQLQLPTAS